MSALVLLGIIVLAVLWLISAYNALVALRNRAAAAWNQIDVQLERRHDLVPNLVETVRGALEYERNTLEAVVAARQRALDAHTPAASAAAEQGLTQALGRLFAVVENYPDLKANQNVLQLQEELTNTENLIAFARDPQGQLDRSRHGTQAIVLRARAAWTQARERPIGRKVRRESTRTRHRKREVVMRTLATLMAAGFAFALTVGDAPRIASPAAVQVADMDMGPDGPQLGGSQNDMVLDDPGHVPAEAGMITSDPGHVPGEAGMIVDDPGTLPPAPDMVVTDPGFVPREAQMDVGTPQDDDQQDDITQ